MDPTQLLPTIAEVAVTLAALSGIAGFLGARLDESAGDERTRILLRDVAAVGLAAALLSLAPLVFTTSAGPDVLTWRVFSGVAAAYWIASFLAAVPKLRRLSRVRGILGSIGPAATACGLILFSWNLVAPDAFSPRRYAAGLLGLLVVAGSNFILAVFGPAED